MKESRSIDINSFFFLSQVGECITKGISLNREDYCLLSQDDFPTIYGVKLIS